MTDLAPPTLPIYHTHLVGRSLERAEVAGILQQPTARLVTLVGDSGAGKTRLALEVAATLTSVFPAGIAFVSLAPVQDPSFVIPTIAATLAIKELPHEPLLTTLAAALHDRPMLLMLDNVEQVRAAGPDILRLIQETESLQVLATSQLALGLPSEITYNLPPLGLPPETARLEPAALLQYPAIALFVNRLQAVQPRFLLTAANATPVRRICELLNGFPLAIELVAAHSAALAPTDLLLLLRNYLGVNPRQPEGENSSRADILTPVLDWCTSRLPALAQTLLQGLGVFGGGWMLESAQAVLAPTISAKQVAKALGVLVQKHLILEETLPGSATRYVVLDAIRAYSEERLVAMGQRTECHDRHIQYFLDLAERAIPLAKQGIDQLKWLVQLRSEQHNLRVALEWGARHQEGLYIRLAAVLGWFWRTSSQLREARSWLGRGLTLRAESEESRGNLLYETGLIEYKFDNNRQAQDYFKQSLAIHEACGNRWGAAETLSAMANSYCNLGDFEAALAIQERLVAICEELGKTWAKAVAVTNISHIQLVLQNWDSALAAAEQAYQMAIDAGDLVNVSAGLAKTNMAWAVYGAHRYTAALDYFREALRIHRALEGYPYIPEELEGLAGVYGALGEVRHGAKLLGAAAALRERVYVPLAEMEQARYYNGIMEVLRLQASAAEFTLWWDEGRDFDLDTLINQILEWRPESS